MLGVDAPGKHRRKRHIRLPQIQPSLPAAQAPATTSFSKEVLALAKARRTAQQADRRRTWARGAMVLLKWDATSSPVPLYLTLPCSQCPKNRTPAIGQGAAPGSEWAPHALARPNLVTSIPADRLRSDPLPWYDAMPESNVGIIEWARRRETPLKTRVFSALKSTLG